MKLVQGSRKSADNCGSVFKSARPHFDSAWRTSLKFLAHQFDDLRTLSNRTAEHNQFWIQHDHDARDGECNRVGRLVDDFAGSIIALLEELEDVAHVGSGLASGCLIAPHDADCANVQL